MEGVRRPARTAALGRFSTSEFILSYHHGWISYSGSVLIPIHGLAPLLLLGSKFSEGTSPRNADAVPGVFSGLEKKKLNQYISTTRL